MKTAIIFIIILASLAAAFFSWKKLQDIISPRQSLTRLFLFMIACLAMVFLICFLMVYIIIRLYPGELRG